MVCVIDKLMMMMNRDVYQIFGNSHDFAAAIVSSEKLKNCWVKVLRGPGGPDMTHHGN